MEGKGRNDRKVKFEREKAWKLESGANVRSGGGAAKAFGRRGATRRFEGDAGWKDGRVWRGSRTVLLLGMKMDSRASYASLADEAERMAQTNLSGKGMEGKEAEGRCCWTYSSSNLPCPLRSARVKTLRFHFPAFLPPSRPLLLTITLTLTRSASGRESPRSWCATCSSWLARWEQATAKEWMRR